jgi:hypothetical protein
VAVEDRVLDRRRAAVERQQARVRVDMPLRRQVDQRRLHDHAVAHDDADVEADAAQPLEELLVVRIQRLLVGQAELFRLETDLRRVDLAATTARSVRLRHHQFGGEAGFLQRPERGTGVVVTTEEDDLQNAFRIGGGAWWARQH